MRDRATATRCRRGQQRARRPHLRRASGELARRWHRLSGESSTTTRWRPGAARPTVPRAAAGRSQLEKRPRRPRCWVSWRRQQTRTRRASARRRRRRRRVPRLSQPMRRLREVTAPTMPGTRAARRRRLACRRATAGTTTAKQSREPTSDSAVMVMTAATSKVNRSCPAMRQGQAVVATGKTSQHRPRRSTSRRSLPSWRRNVTRCGHARQTAPRDPRHRQSAHERGQRKDDRQPD